MRMSSLVPTHHKQEAAVRNTNPENFHRRSNQLWFSFKPRINLSPFTKDFVSWRKNRIKKVVLV
jgi:hypothetical protein